MLKFSTEDVSSLPSLYCMDTWPGLSKFTSVLHKMLRFTPPIMVALFGLVIRIPGFHPGGLGSVPGMETFFVILKGSFFAISSEGQGW